MKTWAGAGIRIRRQDKLEIQKPDRIGKSIRLYVGVSGLL